MIEQDDANTPLTLLSNSLTPRSQQPLEEEQQVVQPASNTSQPARQIRQSQGKDQPLEQHYVNPDYGDPSSHTLSYTGYPMPANSFVQRATQFYVKCYSPAATQRPHYFGVGQDLTLLRGYIPYVLNDKMIFCAMVAMSSMAANIAASGNCERTPETLKFYHFAVSLLRQRLVAEGDQPSDAVIITLSSLCGFEAMSGNYEGLDMHTKGIKHVVALRGGVDCLGFDGFLKTIAIAWQTFYNARHSKILDDEELFPKTGGLTYPVHPFEPALCEAISRLPKGLSEMCLSGLLSHQIILLVGRITYWSQNMAKAFEEADVYRLHRMSTNSRNVTLCGEFLHRSDVSLIEQLLVLALMGFCYSLDETRAMFWITNAYLQIRCRHLINAHIEVAEHNQNHVVWIGTTLLATFDPGTQASMLGMSLLNARTNHWDWQKNVKLCEDYFWNDALSLKLAAKVGHLTRRRLPIER